MLLALAAILIFRHVAAWRNVMRNPPDDREYAFRKNQFRRRMQTSVAMALVALAMLAGQWITAPAAGLVYWSGVLAMVCWIAAMALLDLRSTRAHYQQERSELADERAALEQEIRHWQQTQNHDASEST